MNSSAAGAGPGESAHQAYRADIDGLRAVAVLSVVGFHAFPNVVKGGFVGVDVFFVISGFLISTIIFSALEQGRFSFLEFYGRRIRRIFPALLLVLVACYAFGWFALLADEFKQLGKHIAGGAGFASNFVLWNESGYFDNAAETKPLLHLWSLGIEEQFYIAWPLLLWAAWKRRLNLLSITVVIAVVSFVLNVKNVSDDVLAAFYSPQTRFWELSVGSILAYLTLYKQERLAALTLRADRWLGAFVYAQAPPPNGDTLRNVLSVLGCVLIAIAVVLITKASRFPGWWALLPTLGSALIITAGSRAWLNRVVLSHRAMVWFGLISFPLYLWHWPLLSFARILEGGTPSREIRIVAVLIAIALAWLTFVLLEKPIRHGLHKRAKAIALVVLMTAAGIAGYATWKADGIESRAANSRVEAADKTLHDVHFNTAIDRINQNCRDIIGTVGGSVYCQMMSKSPRILFVGDSHAITFAYSQVAAGNSEIGVVAGHGCLPLLSFLSIEKQVPFDAQLQVCQGAIQSALKIAKQTPSIQYIVLVSRGPLYIDGKGFGVEGDTMHFSIRDVAQKRSVTNEEAFVAGFLETIREFQKLGKKVILAIDVPEIGIDMRTCVDSRPMRITRKPVPECAISLEAYEKRNAVYRGLIAEVVRQSTAVEVFDPKDILCDREKCYGRKGDQSFYYDGDHLSRLGSQMVFDSFTRWLAARPR